MQIFSGQISGEKSDGDAGWKIELVDLGGDDGDSTSVVEVAPNEQDREEQEENKILLEHTYPVELPPPLPPPPQPHRWPRERFVSHDPAENEDNDAPGWEELRRLKTAREFQRYARRKFGTEALESDPTRCLTYHGFLRRRIAADASFLVGREEKGARWLNKVDGHFDSR